MSLTIFFSSIFTAEIRGSLDQIFRTMLANDLIHDISFQGTGTAPVNGNGEAAHASNSQASSSGVGDDGTFLSNLLRQILPIVSQNTSETNNTSVEEDVEDGNARDSSVNVNFSLDIIELCDVNACTPILGNCYIVENLVLRHNNLD